MRKANTTFPKSVRRLWVKLTFTWSAAWLLGLVAFAAMTLVLANRYFDRELESQLRQQAIAVYGLAFFNDDGEFESDLLRYEEDLFEAQSSVWIIEPSHPPQIYLGEDDHFIPAEKLVAIAKQIVNRDGELSEIGVTASGQPYRLYAIPTYEPTSQIPRAAIIVATVPDQITKAKWWFVGYTITAAGLLGIIGIAVGGFVSQKSLTPLAEFLHEREHFLSAAAHELRTPLATLLAVLESGKSANDAPETTLQQVEPLAKKAVTNMEDLLLYSRLEMEEVATHFQPVRLDLLAETCIDEETPVQTDMVELTVLGDSTLLSVAIRLLIDNANRYSTSPDSIRIMVNERGFAVENDGRFQTSLVGQFHPDRKIGPSSSGSGFGLPIVAMIANLHGAKLHLENLSNNQVRASFLFENR